MNIYITHIKKALSSISTEYIIESNSSNRLAERLFAYEFYHQYRHIMEQNLSLYDGLFLTGEQYKIYSQLHGIRQKDAPDIVLSDNMNCIGERQEFLIEIKMKGNPEWLNDLQKLSDFANSSLSFKNHYFIYVGETFSAINNQLMNKCKTIDKFCEKVVIFTCFPNNNSINVEINVISNIL